MLRQSVRALRPVMRAARVSAPSPAARMLNVPMFTTRSFSEKIRVTFIEADGTKKEVTANVGDSFLEVAHNNDVELEGACGGELACSTCHCVFEPSVYATLPPISEEEEDMLDLAWGLTDTSRLGCQIKATKEMDGITLTIPDGTNNVM